MKRVAPCCLGLAVSFLAYPYYVQPSAAVEKEHVQLGARFNYENLETLSMWVGWSFAGGNELAWRVTPTFGHVFGRTTGVAPGLDLDLRMWLVSLTSSNEYVIDARDLSKSFFYTWSELSLAPATWFRFGAVLQRTRLRESARDLQPGFFAGLNIEHVQLTAYVFVPGGSTIPTMVLAFVVKR